ncbi:MAG: helix-turn-helix transcriptional regulator [Chloroflexi bacterium]|nr:helix-turn-helix transcriptional regulator [Ardenticatenaceae bacterium]NOG33942.1 helix-turn-helix transcriptional regulator [Chloroflexota bacterium]
MERIGEKLKALRAQHGLTTRQLAVELEVSQAQISRIENGLRQPDGDLLIRISDFFHISLDRLMRDDLDLT